MGRLDGSSASAATPTNSFSTSALAQLLGPQLAQDVPFWIKQHALSQLGDELEILLDEEDRQPLALVQLAEDDDQLLDDRGLDALGRLVEEDASWAGRQAARDGQQLLLAAAERAAPAVEQGGEPRERLRGSTSMRSSAPRPAKPIRRLSRTLRPGKISRPCGT